MKRQINSVIKKVIASIVNQTSKTKVGEFWNEQILKLTRNRTTKVVHSGIEFNLNIPNALCRWRANTFSSKEPETLEWIDKIPEKSILWDIGANIGLYSIYAAKKRACQVWAFEPAVFNLEILARNIFLNGLTKQVCIVPVALNERLSENYFRMTNIDWGGSMSTFGQNFGWDGNNINSIFEFKTIGLSMVDAMQRLSIPQPDYIKMDVDGIEHLILKGGTDLLRKIKGILLEVNDAFPEQAQQCQEILTQSGLFLEKKEHSEMIANSKILEFRSVYNQIWIR